MSRCSDNARVSADTGANERFIGTRRRGGGLRKILVKSFGEWKKKGEIRRRYKFLKSKTLSLLAKASYPARPVKLGIRKILIRIVVCAAEANQLFPLWSRGCPGIPFSPRGRCINTTDERTFLRIERRQQPRLMGTYTLRLLLRFNDPCLLLSQDASSDLCSAGQGAWW